MAPSAALFFRSLAPASIRTKLTLALAGATALFVAIGPFGLLQLHAINGVVQEIRQVRLPRIARIESIKRLVSEHELLAARWIRTADARQADDLAQSLAAKEQSLQDARDALRGGLDAEERHVFDDFQALWAAYHDALWRGGTRQAGAVRTPPTADQFEAARRSAEGALAALDRLAAVSTQRSFDAAAHADSVTRAALTSAVAGTILAALITLALITWATRHICSPLLEVSRAMQLLAAGDDAVAIAGDRNRRDEIGTLIAAASKFRSALVCSREFAVVAEQERERLNAAVNQMPVGLSMFDQSEQLIICNAAFRRMYGMPRELTRPGAALAKMYGACAGFGTASNVLDDYRAAVAESRDRRHTALRLLDLPDGRVISFSVLAMQAGGWVAIHEDITERRHAEERIAHMARYDALTDLPNRILFKERIEDALKRVPRGENIAVICLDLDHFKDINDTLGHPVGDRLLKLVADRLRDCVRDADTVSRFGGDEFAIVQVGSEQPQGAVALAHRILESVSAPYEVDGQRIVIGVSAGIAVAPSDGDEPDVLIKNSDMALYFAKADGRGTFRFFNREMDLRMQERRRLELELHRAVERKEFELYYQPVVDVERQQVTSFEALLRWRHPERGLVPPGEFIPFAEEIGLIVPIGEWVLHRACHDATAWPADVKVAVNLSPVQFKSSHLLQHVVTALAASNLPASRLELEITEGVLLVNTEATIELLHRLRGFGIRIAMDDFGTGYSSLSYLKKFPFDRIKIDGSFVRSISDDASSLAVIRAVAGLGTNLAMATTAEGVETIDQLERLRAEGLNSVQGFLFAPPRPFAETAELLHYLPERLRAAA